MTRLRLPEPTFVRKYVKDLDSSRGVVPCRYIQCIVVRIKRLFLESVNKGKDRPRGRLQESRIKR